jgi:hypothetical protein
VLSPKAMSRFPTTMGAPDGDATTGSKESDDLVTRIDYDFSPTYVETETSRFETTGTLLVSFDATDAHAPNTVREEAPKKAPEAAQRTSPSRPNVSFPSYATAAKAPKKPAAKLVPSLTVPKPPRPALLVSPEPAPSKAVVPAKAEESLSPPPASSITYTAPLMPRVSAHSRPSLHDSQSVPRVSTHAVPSFDTFGAPQPSFQKTPFSFSPLFMAPEMPSALHGSPGDHGMPIPVPTDTFSSLEQERSTAFASCKRSDRYVWVGVLVMLALFGGSIFNLRSSTHVPQAAGAAPPALATVRVEAPLQPSAQPFLSEPLAIPLASAAVPPPPLHTPAAPAKSEHAPEGTKASKSTHRATPASFASHVRPSDVRRSSEPSPKQPPQVADSDSAAMRRLIEASKAATANSL